MSSQAKKAELASEFSGGKVFDYKSLAEAFPEVDPRVNPFGDKVLLQIRTPKKMSAGGILLVEETQETELWNTQVAKVIAIGPTAFKNSDTLEPWPEGAWCKPGMFVRCPKYGGDRWQMPIPGRPGEFALFVQFKELDLSGEVTGNPLDIVAYVY
jgi:co-chaperonin GroES (HSP10)